MTRTIRATYDGELIRPEEPLPLAPNTDLIVTYEPAAETKPAPHETPVSFFEVARSLRFEGPPDLSERLDHYLYGVLVDEEE